MSKWKLGIFDWDGTLFNSVDLNYKASATIFRELDVVPPSREEYLREITSEYSEFYYTHGIPHSVPLGKLDQIRQEYIERHWTESRLNPGAREVLLACVHAHILVAIVTSEIPEILERRIHDFYIAEYIDYLHPNAHDRRGALAETLQRFRISGEDAFYADDIASGLVAAKSIGITTIGVSCGFNSHAQVMGASPDYPKDGRPILSLLKVVDIVIGGGEE